MFKFINLILCFILINNYCQTKELKSLYIDDDEFEKISNIKYNKKDEFLNRLNKDLDTSESENNEITADKRFQNWFDIGEYSNQTAQSSTNKLESNLIDKSDLKGDNKSLNSKKRWRLISSSTLSDTIDNLNTPANITTIKNRKSLKKQRKSRKLKTANLDFKLKDTKFKEYNYIKDKIANTSIYTVNKKDNLKFKLNDAINFKNYNNSNRILLNNNNSISLSVSKSDDQLNRRSQLTSSSSKIHKKIMFAASMLPVIKSLTSAHTQVAVLPTAIAQPTPIALLPQVQPMPVHVNLPQVHIVQPRPIYQQVIARPPPPPQQIITQPIIQQPIIQRKIIQQPVIISRPIHVVRKIKAQPQQIYQTLQIPAIDQGCNQQVAEVDDSNEETTIQDPVDDDDNSVQSDDDSSFSQDSWGNPQPDQQVRIVPQPIAAQQDSWGNSNVQNQQQVRIVPQPIVAQPQQDSWGNSNVQNQKIYTYHTASVPKKTRTIYTQTKMIPQTVHTHIQSHTSYTPEHRHIVVETDHNVKPVMSLVSTGQRKIMTKPVYTVKTMQPTYISNNQQTSWSN